MIFFGTSLGSSYGPPYSLGPWIGYRFFSDACNVRKGYVGYFFSAKNISVLRGFLTLSVAALVYRNVNPNPIPGVGGVPTTRVRAVLTGVDG